MKTQPLKKWADGTLRLLQTHGSEEDPDAIVLQAGDLAEVPSQLFTEEMLIEHDWKAYKSWAIQRVIWTATRDALGALGVALLASAFQRRAFRLEIRGSDSVVKTVQVQADRLKELEEGQGLEIAASKFTYYAGDVEKYPWFCCGHSVLAEHLPVFRIAAAGDEYSPWFEAKEQDCLILDNRLHGAVRLAALLLDMSQEKNSQLTVDLESEAGWRGVGPGSTEATFLLDE